MMAEVIVDVLGAALGASRDFGSDVPPGAQAIEVAPNRVQDPELARIFRIFGRPERTSTCDCQRGRASSVPQTLFLMTDPKLLDQIEHGRLQALAQDEHQPDRNIVEELFLATLSRFPDEPEMRSALDQFAAQ